MPDSAGGIPAAPDAPLPLAWSLSQADWSALVSGLGQPSFRARQIWDWLYRRGVGSFAEMANLPASLRSELAARLRLAPWLETDSLEDPESGTRKILLECLDGERIECVVIPSDGSSTLCVSTQAGCAFGCAFCATGNCGFRRNLDAGEIVGQYFAARKAAPSPLTHIVFMGMGEPFANYENTLRAVRIFNSGDGLAIGARRITLSTCGVVPGILRLAEEGLQVELAVSLHAPDDALRSSIMPVNRRWAIAELLAACRAFNAKTKRIVTFEYTLVDGVNDSDACARKLAGLLDPSFARVNLIPLSPVGHYEGRRPSPARCRGFASVLQAAGLNVTLRHSKGSSVAAACGQLRLGNPAPTPQPH